MKKVNEVSRLSGVSKRTLQYYDEIELLSTQRSKTNHRLYDNKALERLWQILVYRVFEFELQDIQHFLTLSKNEQNKVLDYRIKEIRDRIQQLDERICLLSTVKQQGIPPLPSDNEITYLDHIERWKESVPRTKEKENDE